MTGPIHILYVDDYPLDRQLVRDALEKEHGGFQVTEAASRTEFEAALVKGSFDLVLSDFNILGFEGLQVLEAVHAKDKQMPVVIVTGTGSEEVAVEAMKRGAADYVIKTPKHIQRLPITIHAVLEKKHLEEERKQAEERFRAIYENAVEGIYQSTLEGRYLNVNPATARIYGYNSPQEMMVQVLDIKSQIYVHSQDRADFIRLLTENGKVENFEVQIYRKDRSIIWIQTNARLVQSEDEVFFEGFITDITKSKEAEALQDAIYQISEAANAAVDLEDLFQAVHAIIGRVMLARNFYIALYDAENNLLSFPYYVDEVNGFAPIPAARPGRGITEYVIRMGKALLSDAANFEELARQGEVELVGSPLPIWIGAPLRVEGRTIGAMAMQDYADPDVYTERELRMLEYVSSQVAKAIERTRLYEDIRRRNRILSALQEATLAMMGELELSETLQIILTKAGQLMDTENGYIDLITAGEAEITSVINMGAFKNYTGVKMKLGEGLAGRVGKSGLPLAVNDYQSWPGRSQQYIELKVHALVGVPLTLGPDVVGVLGLAYLEPGHTFSQDDMDLLSRFAQLASIALANARLHTQVRQELAERRMAQDALREAEAKYRSLVERLPVVVYTSELGTAGAWDYVSPQIASLLGFTPEEWMADPNLWYQQIHPDDRQRQEALEEQSYARGEPFEGEYRIFTRDGREIWIRDSAQILPPPEGQLPIVQGVLVDITERKQAEKALIESRARLAGIIGAAMDGIITIDAAGRIMEFNPSAEKMFGQTRGQMLGSNLGEMIIPHDLREQHRRGLLRYQATGEAPILGKRLEMTAIRADGSEFPVELSIVRNSTDDSQFFTGFIRDITERKRAEQDLRAAEIRYRTLVEQLPIIVYVNPASDINSTTYVSPQIKPFLGYTQEEWLEDSKSWSKALHPEDSQRVLAEVELINQSGEPFDEEYRMVARDGHVVWIRDQATLLRDSDGLPLLWQGLMIDITESKLAEENLRASELKFRALAENIPSVVYQCRDDARYTFLYLNDAIVELTGYPPKAFLEDGLSFFDLYHPDDLPAILVPFTTQSVINPRSFHITYRIRHKSGEWRWVDEWGTAILDDQGAIQYLQGVMVDITTLKLAEDKIKRQVNHLTALRMIDMTITASADLHLSLQAILKQAIAQLQIDAADILLLNPTTHILEYADGIGFHTRGIERSSVRIGEGNAGRAVLERKMVSVHSLYESRESFSRRSLLEGENFTDYYGVPLIAKGEVKGVLEVFHRAHMEVDREWVDFLESMAGQAGLAIDNATLFQNLQRSNLELGMAYETTLEGWSAALDLRDKETEGHTLRVTNLTLQLAEHMGLKDKDLVQIRRGALLHDIGKMGVPDRILLKPDNLTNEEWEIMRRHPAYAHELLSRIEYLRPALGIPYCHHEKWDGTGYPRGLMGEEIPLEARLFSVVDVYDALVSDRPYRPAWTKERALAYIKSLSGVDFDPRVVDGFLELLAQY